MALRDQPYLPLYVQDYLTDEKLNECSASAQGVYIKIMCIMHKMETYGKIKVKQKDKKHADILFKQNSKQNQSKCFIFAYKLAKLLPFDLETILDAITELVEEEVLVIEGDYLVQKRMVKDFETSLQRSKAAKKGGGNPNLNKQNAKNLFKQNPKQNTESESENEYENKTDNDNEVEILENYPFEDFWNLYEKKGNRKTSLRRWQKLPDKTKEKIMQHVPVYVKSTPDKQYRKNAETYLNQEVWNDEIIYNHGNSKSDTRNQKRAQLARDIAEDIANDPDFQ